MSRNSSNPVNSSGPNEDEIAAGAWPAMWSIIIGFFMILVDATIVMVAIDTIMTELRTDVNTVLWVTSAYLLAYAVPLLIAGRLGDRYGQKNMYLAGLAIFTVASFGCGFSTSITALIIWRVVQGLGAALMTPQTMSIITRIFPPRKRGAAFGVWGATAGAATLVGPILGGVLTDLWGWQWIFYVNVPVGIIGFVLAVRFVPHLSTRSHAFDWLGVFLSAVGMFFIVFGVQESGQNPSQAVITRAWSYGFIAIGVVVFIGFVVWQHYNRSEPLVPLSLFKDTNFSVSNIAIAFVGAWISTFALPVLLFMQNVEGFSPTQSALMLLPQALLSGILSVYVGNQLMPKISVKWIAVVGVACCVVGLTWYVFMLNTSTPVWMFLLPAALLGIGNSGMWSPLSMAATHNLSGALAGAGSGVFNATRQVGAVIGSATLAAVLSNRMATHMPQPPATGGGEAPPTSGQLPEFLHDSFSAALSETMWMPVIACVLVLLAVFFLNRTGHSGPDSAPPKQTVSTD